MSVTSVRKLADIAEKIGSGKDARTVIINAIGADLIEQFEPAHDLVLVATYIRSDKTKSGLILGGDRTRAEDRFQGKIGLVLKTGLKLKTPEPFGDDAPILPGQWIMYRASDAHEFFFVQEDKPLDGASVRLIEKGLIFARVQNPESVF
jgi:co-chaperonin GroES (HSP10)